MEAAKDFLERQANLSHKKFFLEQKSILSESLREIRRKNNLQEQKTLSLVRDQSLSSKSESFLSENLTILTDRLIIPEVFQQVKFNLRRPKGLINCNPIVREILIKGGIPQGLHCLAGRKSKKNKKRTRKFSFNSDFVKKNPSFRIPKSNCEYQEITGNQILYFS